MNVHNRSRPDSSFGWKADNRRLAAVALVSLGMARAKKWDSLSIAAAVLCAAPEVVTGLHVGFPNDVGLIVVPIAALLLGTPQIAMLAYVLTARTTALRVVYLATSVAMLGYYYHRLTTGDLSSSSTAGVGLFFVVFYMALGSAAAGAVLLRLERLLLRSSDSV